MREWSVTVGGRGYAGGEKITDENALDLAEILAPKGAAVGHTPDRISATFTVRAATAGEVSDKGRAIFEAALKKSKAPAILIDELEAIDHERLSEVLAAPTVPDLVGVQEAAAILAVSRQRVSELASTSKSFPRAVAHLAAGPVWARSAIESFKKHRPGKPGRPSKASQVDAERDRATARLPHTRRRRRKSRLG